MAISIQHNMGMLNANRQLNINTKKKTKSAEKLSSGYRINRAADDAAGLSISEKMRWMIRGLNKGTENAQDGVSWVQIGDGSLEETHAMLHRMTELAVKASNGTCTDSDRMMMQAEFNQLQKEVDRLTDNTYFNEKHIFNEHEDTYYQIKGEMQWPEGMIHTVRAGENDLTVVYRQKETDKPKSATITVPLGDYTTRELIDEIDTALSDAGLLDEGVMFEYTDTGLCNLNLEGGEKIDEVSGGLSYLLYDQYGGGSLGALIGTTIFWTDKSTLNIVAGQNDELKFWLISAEDENDRTEVEFTLKDGRYTKEELMTNIDNAIKGALKDHPDKEVKVSPHGTGIMLSSPDYIVSEFKGNMFEIDADAITSVFYDNVHHAAVINTPAWFQGAGVLQDPDYDPPSYRDENGSVPENEVFHIQKGKNDVLVLRANGEEKPIVIDDLASQDGKNIREMCAFLNGKLNAHDLLVSVEEMGTGYQKDINGVSNPVQYLGLRITSTKRGPGSRIDFDMSKSTAYATLFTSQPTISYANDAVFVNASTPDKNARLESRKPLNGLIVDKDKNDAFTVSLTDRSGTTTSLTVTIDGIKYGSADALASEIQTKLRAEMKKAGLDETKVTVSAEGGEIVIEGDASFAREISVGEVSGNNGYKDIFVGDKIVPNEKLGTGANAQVELPIAAQVDASGKVTIPQGQRELRVRVDNEGMKNDEGAIKWHRMTLNATYDSLQALEEHIKKELGEKTTAIQFSPVDAKGTTSTTSVSKTTGKGGSVLSGMGSYKGKGNIILKKEDNPTGQGTGSEVEKVEPAVVTFGKKITEPVEITYQNKLFSFTLNEGGDKKEVSIDLSTELDGKTKFNTAQEFCEALQKAVTTKLGNRDPSKVGGVQVTQNNGVITLTAGILKDNGKWDESRETNITMGIGAGSFIYDLHNVGKKTQATLKGSGKGLNSSFKVKADTSFTLNITKPDAAGTPQTTPIDLKLKVADGEYTIPTLISKLNGQLDGTGVTAGYSYDSSTRGYYLTFTMNGKDDKYKIEITSDANCDAMKYMFGYAQGDGSGTYDFSLKNAAVATLDKKVQSNITFDNTEDRHFLVKVDGNSYNIELDKAYAKPDDLASAIKTKVNAMSVAQGKGNVLDDVWIDSAGQLNMRTISKKGTDSRIEVTYNKDSAMKKIFGYTSQAGVEGKFDPTTNKLTLKRVGGTGVAANSRSVYVVSELADDEGRSAGYVGGSFIVSDPPEELPPKGESGAYSGIHSSMDGVDLKFNANGKVDINEFNNQLTFWYSDDYGALNAKTPREITATIKTGEYSMTDLETALQNALDKDKKTFEVTVTKAGVHIETVNVGMKHRIYTNKDYSRYRPSGGFYEQIMCSAEKSTTGKPVKPPTQGGHNGHEVYAVGRQDVKNKTVKIQKDGNDKLSLELSVPGGKTYTLKMTLDPGYYQGDTLVKQIQKKLDEALVKEGLPKGLIEAGIGLVDTKIYGAIDDRALAFRLSEKVAVPVESTKPDDQYGIEAIGGTAAFSVFYQTEGDITRAYVKGGKDISQGIEIKQGATGFSVDVDGTTYKIELEPKFYSAEELVTHINQKMQSDLNGKKVPLTAMLDEGKVKLMHTKLGKHKITNLKGAVKNQLFFTEKGEKKDDSIHLRMSSVSGDWVEIDRPWMNTMSLGINSLTLSKYKYAQKAITRLKEAVTKVGDVRSYFGATQNRLESTIRNNENKAENTQAAESRIRDADISREVLENSIHNILEQTGASVMAQGKQNAQLVLQMLA